MIYKKGMSSFTVKSKRFINGRNEQHEKLDRENSDQLSTNQENFKIQSNSWSEGKVKNEISSFIDEFSYLTNGNEEKRHSQQYSPRISLQTYQVYPAQLHDRNSNTGFHSNTKKPTDSKTRRKKNIRWKNEQNHNKQQSESRLFDGWDANIERETNSITSKSSKLRRDEKYIPNKLRPVLNNRSRSQLKKMVLKRGSNQNKRSHSRLRSRSPLTHTKYRASSKSPIRSQSTDFYIKHIPLRYMKRRRNSRQHFPSPILTDIKTLITAPSVITLYPINSVKREDRIIPKYNQAFLIDSHIACKCYKCMKKYSSLMKLTENKQTPNKKKLKTLNKIQDYDWCYRDSVGPWEQSYRCTNEAKSELEKSLYFKFNSYCQRVDSKITQYFHSILDQACCD